jgi:MFS family permease
MPLILTMIFASYVAGTLITRTGRYRFFPISGTLLTALGMALLASLDGSSSRTESSIYMGIVGVGLGFVAQIIVLATQNEVPAQHLGVATSAVNFFRSIGGSIGVAVVGALFTSRLATSVQDVIGQREPLDPSAVHTLPPGTRQAYVDGFAGALTSTLALLVPLMAVGVVLALCLREAPLRTSTHAAPMVLE